MFFNYKNNYNMNGTLSTSTIKTDTLPMANPSVRQGTLPMMNTLVRQDIVKSHIIQQIENLKTDIQNLLDKKKFISNDEMGDWTINKNEKMSQLKILTEKLKEINKKERSELRMNNERNKLAEIYYKNIIQNDKLRILKPIENCKSNIHLFILVVEERDNLKKYLEENNINCAIHYPQPFYETEAYKHLILNHFEKMEFFKNKLLTLPMYPELSEESIKHICEQINKYYKLTDEL